MRGRRRKIELWLVEKKILSVVREGRNYNDNVPNVTISLGGRIRDFPASLQKVCRNRTAGIEGQRGTEAELSVKTYRVGRVCVLSIANVYSVLLLLDVCKIFHCSHFWITRN